MCLASPTVDQLPVPLDLGWSHVDVRVERHLHLLSMMVNLGGCRKCERALENFGRKLFSMLVIQARTHYLYPCTRWPVLLNPWLSVTTQAEQARPGQASTSR